MTAGTTDDTIVVAHDGWVATVTLNRPDKLNALTKAMWRGLGETITGLSRDTSLRCIIVRGAGVQCIPTTLPSAAARTPQPAVTRPR